MPKVLVVDDEKNIREALEEFLTDEGYEVSLAEDGHKGLEKFKNEDYDLVFMDVRMPGIDGIETLHMMKQSKPEVKVVIITGMPDETTFDRAVSVSPDIVHGFLAKPFKPDDIRKCLQTILAGGKVQTFQLNPKQIKALSKLGEQCAQNATLALGQILHREINIALQKIDIIPLQHSMKVSEEETSLYVVLSVKALGKITGEIIVFVPWGKGLNLIDLFEKRPIGATQSFDGKAQMILKTAGNILAG
ncbi:MAG: response regulator, partial [Elusimicrobiota bacterium]|nr:response regulator [Elusimicrobiota bacterium]